MRVLLSKEIVIMIYFEAPYLTISWDEPNACVIVVWRGFFTSEKMRSGAEKALELVKAQGAKKYLTDTSESRVVSPDDQNWIATDWRPRAIEAGLTKMATVIPTDLIARMAMNRLKSIMNGVETGYFGSMEEAKRWLGFNAPF
jgi:hypothetical protein